ncbi:MAG: hypothetical protein IT290_06490 [Deltaproteobacteria bacterium]|nr:hypothetical protein [Deltaproteobacteria bacterium]
MNLGWLSGGTVTGIGSLPGNDAERAWEASLRWCPLLPFEPTFVEPLVRGRGRVGWMLTELFPDSAELFEEFPEQGLIVRREAETRFAELLADHTPEFSHNYSPQFLAHRIVKSQLAGPLTIATCLRFQGSLLIEHPSVFALLSSYLQRVARTLVTALSAKGAVPVVFVDEPMFSPELRDPGVDALDALLLIIQESGGVPGVHSCAEALPPSWDRRPASIISFDATTPLRFREVLESPEAARFAERGGTFALGAVSPVRSLDRKELLSGMARLDAKVRTSIFEHSLITPSCGLGLTSWSTAEETFASAFALAGALTSAEHV